MESGYKVCGKCGVRFSTLTKHRCFKPEEQKERPEFDNPPPGDGNEPGEGEGDGSDQSDGQGEQSEREGEGQGEGEGEAEGEGEGEAEGDGEGSGQAPEEEIPPAAVVCTVLKFAALTARGCTAMIKIELGEAGMEVYGYNGDEYETALIPWGEFEKRSTLDGEYYVKEIIDAVDEKLSGKREPEFIEQTGDADDEADDEGWIEWAGGEKSPVPGETEVEVELRSGSRVQQAARVWCWDDLGMNSDIVRYRVVKV